MATGSTVRKLSYQTGTDGIWTFRKYDDHTYHAWYEGAVNFEAGTAWLGGYFHRTGSDLPAPSFSTGITSMSASSNGAQLVVYVGNSLGSGNRPYFWDAVATTESGKAVRIDMYGTW